MRLISILAIGFGWLIGLGLSMWLYTGLVKVGVIKRPILSVPYTYSSGDNIKTQEIENK